MSTFCGFAVPESISGIISQVLAKKGLLHFSGITCLVLGQGVPGDVLLTSALMVEGALLTFGTKMMGNSAVKMSLFTLPH